MITQKIQNRIRSKWIELRPVKATKVFGIGLPKTGTTSLGYCMRRFGFKHRTFDMDLAVHVLFFFWFTNNGINHFCFFVFFLRTSDPVSFFTRSIPQMGQDPGALRIISGCMGQV